MKRLPSMRDFASVLLIVVLGTTACQSTGVAEGEAAGSESTEQATTTVGPLQTTSERPEPLIARGSSSGNTDRVESVQLVTSRAGFSVEIPEVWMKDTTASADSWIDSYTGPDGQFIRSDHFDRPDRSPFVDSTDEGPVPNLNEVVVELAGLFPDEFGENPEIRPIELDGRPAYVLTAAPDSSVPTRTTYIMEANVSSWRFLELQVNAESDPIISSLVWLR